MVHPTMVGVQWNPERMVEKARGLRGADLREWLETVGLRRVFDADEDVRPFVRLLQIMKEDERYREAGLESWGQLCSVLRIAPDLAEQLEEGVRLLRGGRG